MVDPDCKFKCFPFNSKRFSGGVLTTIFFEPVELRGYNHEVPPDPTPKGIVKLLPATEVTLALANSRFFSALSTNSPKGAFKTPC